jgi:hypothetical protein
MAAAEGLVDLLDLDRPLGNTVELAADRRGVEVRDVMVVARDHRRRRRRSTATRSGSSSGPVLASGGEASGRQPRAGAGWAGRPAGARRAAVEASHGPAGTCNGDDSRLSPYLN